MATRIKISNNASERLECLSRKLDLRRNIVCRLAIGRSLKHNEPLNKYKLRDSNGFEFNRYTITGEYDTIYKALVIQYKGEKINDREYFLTYIRKHIERGVQILFNEYQKINSPIEFISFLIHSK